MVEIAIDQELRKKAIEEVKQNILKQNGMSKGPADAVPVAEEMANTAFAVSLESAVRMHRENQARVRETSDQIDRLKQDFWKDVSSAEGVNVEGLQSWLDREVTPMVESKLAADTKHVRDFTIFGFTMLGVTEETAEAIVDNHIFTS